MCRLLGGRKRQLPCKSNPSASFQERSNFGTETCIAKINCLQGDSGGPLVKVERGQWTLYGAVSWGYQCAADEHPTLYAKVINYLDWIHETMDNNS